MMMNLEPLQPQSLSQPNQPSSSSSGLQAPKPPSKQEKKKKAKKKDFPAPVAVKQKLEKTLANGEFEQFAKEYSRIAKAKRQKEEMKKRKNKGKPKIKPTKRSLSAQPWLLSRALWILASVLWPLNRLFCLFALVVITTMLLVGRRLLHPLPLQQGDRFTAVQLLCLIRSPASSRAFCSTTETPPSSWNAANQQQQQQQQPKQPRHLGELAHLYHPSRLVRSAVFPAGKLMLRCFGLFCDRQTDKDKGQWIVTGPRQSNNGNKVAGITQI